ncbi:MAG TPA: hypothetical protein RMG45_16690, partial [Polyangiaceae bacterium LLY-WYZ-15_(1-7)]|nr:hypothetical protein [Polyangiaceae bacterium LLY-WYZ-15_(1-7)]
MRAPSSLLLVAFFSVAGCSCGDDDLPTRPCTTAAECAAGERCVDLICQPGIDGGGLDAAMDAQ